jgi:hypothetical protein
MAVTIKTSTAPAHQKDGGDTKTGPLGNLIDARRQPGHDPDPTSVLRHQQRSEQPYLPVNQIDATYQPD